MNKQALYALPEDEGKRMDKYLSEQLPDKTRSFLAKLCGDGRILVNGAVQGKNYKLKAGDSITVEIPAPVSLSAEPEDIPLDIVYEDGDLLVVNKPKGMVVHPAAGNYSHTLVNALLYHCGGSLSGIGGVVRPGIVHRIDKDTSGLLIIAKNDRAHQGLAGQIKEHSFTREYETVVHGNIKTDEGTVDAPLGRHPSDRKRWRSRKTIPGMPFHIIRCWNASVRLHTLPYGLKRAGRIKSACIWRISAIPWRGTRITALKKR